MSDNELVKTASETISRHKIFGDLLSIEEKQYLMERGIVNSYSVGEFICKQHERDSNLYIVLMGEVEVTEGDTSNRLVLAHLGKGDIFGEISALFQIPRISNVIATKPTVVLEISGDIFEGLGSKNPALLKAIMERFGNRLIETALRNVSFLRYIPIESLSVLIDESTLVSIPPGVEIITEGEPGDAMFVVVHGAARVSRMINGQLTPVSIVNPGDYFGEWAVLTGAPRIATVVALSHIELIRVDRSVILQFIQDNPGIRDRIDQIAHMRREKILGEDLQGVDDRTEKLVDDISTILGKNKTS